jgi:hypothetical protein
MKRKELQMRCQYSSSVTTGGTVLQEAVKILRARRGKVLLPAQIAQIGLDSGVFAIPRGRTFGYLSQVIQSTLYCNAYYAQRAAVTHCHRGYAAERK